MKIITHTIKPKIPEALAPLDEMAHNLWISWNFDAIMLFIRLDYDVWSQSRQNPAKMLGMVPQARFDAAAADDSYLAALREVYTDFQAYKNGQPWFKGDHKDSIAYFSMEYGMDSSLPIYSGGLGILSGDHMKTSSDMGLPLVGVGLLYRQGYFIQQLNADGFQQEEYPENDWYNMPVSLCETDKGEPVRISVEMAGETIVAQVWVAMVGRSSLYLLDTNIEENIPQNRTITATLYGGDKETRIRQEILLGIGGIRALRAVGINPAVAHMNEGHAAFLGLERIHEIIQEKGLSFPQAAQALWGTNIFTTHTPVPAGNERFSIELMEKYFRGWISQLGLDWKAFLALGRERPDDDAEPFCMTVLALKLSAYANGVSELHGHVSRDMWKAIWPGLPSSEVPIGHVTNGVHPRTWIPYTLLEVLNRYFGPHFQEDPTDLSSWDRIDRISDDELWRTHERRRERLVAFARDRLKKGMRRIGISESGLARADDALSPATLTISFARRFATYKRGNLLLSDPDRLIRLLSDKDRPIQIIFAGKAHPHDMPGKEIIKELVHFSRRDDVAGRIVFLEDYDMTMARYMTSGSDVWLNTPRRPLEASGTSGMKAGMNGVLNCSVLDGWWAEGYAPECGWAIGKGEEYTDTELQDEIESKALYDLLEREIIPTFYERGRDGLPREWIKMMKCSIRNTGKNFSFHRTLMEYSEHYYQPALENARLLATEGYDLAKATADFIDKARAAWPTVSVEDIYSTAKPVMERGDTVRVEARIKLGSLTPEQVRVELYHGPVSSTGDIHDAKRVEMKAGVSQGGAYSYLVNVTCEATGQHGYSVRVLPRHEGLVHPFVPGLVRWA
ncbi:MAG: alpha-glucan family phosphorylase [Spirochaetia bacterium]|jgi:starch phosphorylase|nr:alpha-glucan family phosphorylase [Spirochaetia bacterium]